MVSPRLSLKGNATGAPMAVIAAKLFSGLLQSCKPSHSMVYAEIQMIEAIICRGVYPAKVIDVKSESCKSQ